MFYGHFFPTNLFIVYTRYLFIKQGMFAIIEQVINQVIKYKFEYINQCCSRWINQSDCSIHIKLN